MLSLFESEEVAEGVLPDTKFESIYYELSNVFVVERV